MYKNSLFSICLRYSNSRVQAEDWLQEGFITIFNKIAKYDSQKGAFYTWASRVMINCILMEKRKHKIDFLSIEGSSASNSAHNHDLLADLQYKDVVRCIQHLPNGFRTVFNLYTIEGYTHKEIAEQLGISVSTSKTQLMRAKAALKKIVSKLENHHISNQIIERHG